MNKESNHHKTSFYSYHGLCQFAKIPFGLCNAPKSFQRSIDIILSLGRFKYVMVYFEDVILFYGNVEHLWNLETVLSLLQNNGMNTMLNKHFFMHGSIEYLGHIVKAQEMSVPPKK